MDSLSTEANIMRACPSDGIGYAHDIENTASVRIQGKVPEREQVSAGHWRLMRADHSWDSLLTTDGNHSIPTSNGGLICGIFLFLMPKRI